MMAINTRAAAATAAKYIEEADNTNRDAPAVGASCWPGGISKDVITLANFIGSKIHILSLSLSAVSCPPLPRDRFTHASIAAARRRSLTLTHLLIGGRPGPVSLSLSLCVRVEKEWGPGLLVLNEPGSSRS